MKTVDYPNGVTAVYDYDALNRLTDLVWQNGSGQLYRYHYSLYADGQRARVTEYDNTDTQAAEYVWDYDNLNRLVQEQYTNGVDDYTHQYVYDIVGNRLEKNILSGSGDDTAYSYNDLDQLITEVSGASTLSYVYDNNGAMTQKVYGTDLQNDPSDVYVYNLQGRLTGFVPDTGSAVQYAYNPSGVRTSKTIAGITTRYLVDPYNPTGYAQILQSDDGTDKTFYVLGSDVIGQSLNTGLPVYFLYDGHGSVAHDTDASGAVTNSYAYDAYGNLIGGNPAEDGLYYTGEMYDAALGQIYLRDRYYNPRNGRFNQMDRFAGSNFNPQSLHKYLYCYANPINAIDPTGKLTKMELMTVTTILSIFHTLVGPALHNKIKHEKGEMIEDWKSSGISYLDKGLQVQRQRDLDAITDPDLLYMTNEFYHEMGESNRLITYYNHRMEINTLQTIDNSLHAIEVIDAGLSGASLVTSLYNTPTIVWGTTQVHGSPDHMLSITKNALAKQFDPRVKTIYVHRPLSEVLGRPVKGIDYKADIAIEYFSGQFDIVEFRSLSQSHLQLLKKGWKYKEEMGDCLKTFELLEIGDALYY